MGWGQFLGLAQLTEPLYKPDEKPFYPEIYIIISKVNFFKQIKKFSNYILLILFLNLS